MTNVKDKYSYYHTYLITYTNPNDYAVEYLNSEIYLLDDNDNPYGDNLRDDIYSNYGGRFNIIEAHSTIHTIFTYGENSNEKNKDYKRDELDINLNCDFLDEEFGEDYIYKNEFEVELDSDTVDEYNQPLITITNTSKDKTFTSLCVYIELYDSDDNYITTDVVYNNSKDEIEP